MLGRMRKDLRWLRWEDQPDLAQRQRAAAGNAEKAVNYYVVLLSSLEGPEPTSPTTGMASRWPSWLLSKIHRSSSASWPPRSGRRMSIVRRRSTAWSGT